MRSFHCQREAILLFASKNITESAFLATDDNNANDIQFRSINPLSVSKNHSIEEGIAIYNDTMKRTKRSRIVIKTLRFSSKQQKIEAEKEATFHKTLRHPNLVRCLHVSREGSELKILLEHCKYYDLDHYSGAFTAYTSGRIIAQLLSALHYIHTLPYSFLFFVHGDIKRSNCFLDDDRNQKLGDFGTTHFQEYDGTSFKRFLADDQHGVTKSYLPYFRDCSPIVSQCTDMWAAHLVIISILGDLTSFFQFSNTTSLSYYLQHYCSDLLDALDGHDPRYAEFFSCFSSKEAINAYYSASSTDHDILRAHLRGFMRAPPIRRFLSLTPLFSSNNKQETPFFAYEETARSFIRHHQEYTEQTLLTLAATATAKQAEKDKFLSLTPEGPSEITFRTVYFTSDCATVYEDPFVASFCEEIAAINLSPKLLDWLVRLGLMYIETQKEFRAVWPSMYAELIAITTTTTTEVSSSGNSLLLLPCDDFISCSLGKEHVSSLQLCDEFDIIQTALSNVGVQNASYVWSLIMDYVIICPGPKESLVKEICTQPEIRNKI